MNIVHNVQCMSEDNFNCSYFFAFFPQQMKFFLKSLFLMMRYTLMQAKDLTLSLAAAKEVGFKCPITSESHEM